MQGRNTLWLPGTDHAGIATQKRRSSARWPRGASPAKSSAARSSWSASGSGRSSTADRIIGQLKRLGCSCDWSRTRFTMDEGLAAAVAEAFCRLYEKGLVYRGRYLVNWCPRCRTALAGRRGRARGDRRLALATFRYPATDGGEGVVVATTRPETMLGDTAVAVHPEDARYASSWARSWPALVGREIPVVGRRGGRRQVRHRRGQSRRRTIRQTSKSATATTSRGCPSSTPTRGSPRRAARYAGLGRKEAREAVLRDLEAQGLWSRLSRTAARWAIATAATRRWSPSSPTSGSCA